MRADALSPDHRPARARRWLVPPLLIAACAAAAAFAVPAAHRAAVLCAGAAAAAVAAAMAGETARRGRTIAELRRRLDDHVADASHLAHEVLPAAMSRARREAEPTRRLPALTPGSTTEPAMAEALDAVLHRVTDALTEMELQRTSGKEAIVNVAGRIQAEINRMRDEIREMQFRHQGPGMLSDLMRVEHGINVAGRFAAALAVLGGGTPARRWLRPVSLFDVMRAGTGPIYEYRRVEQQKVVDVGVRGDVVEPLILILGELLDNATRYSPPAAKVIMNAEEVATGVEISVEDRGTGLSEERRRRAEFLLHQGVDGVIDFEDLGESARLGLRVAGILASQINARVSLRPSTCDGVRAVVFVPEELLAPAPPPLGPAADNPHPARRGGYDAQRFGEPAQDDLYEYERGPGGLPQRRRRAPLRSTTAPPPPPPRPEPRPLHPGEAAARERPRGRDTSEAGSWVGAFFTGLRRPSAPAGGAPATDDQADDEPRGKGE